MNHYFWLFLRIPNVLFYFFNWKVISTFYLTINFFLAITGLSLTILTLYRNSKFTSHNSEFVSHNCEEKSQNYQKSPNDIYYYYYYLSHGETSFHKY